MLKLNEGIPRPSVCLVLGKYYRKGKKKYFIFGYQKIWNNKKKKIKLIYMFEFFYIKIK